MMRHLSRNLLRLTVLLATCLPGLAGAAPLTTEAEEPGTLFYSPEERASIERTRRGLIASEQGSVPVTLQLNGLVRRSHGKSTAWVNQRPQPEGTLSVPRHDAVVGARGLQVDGQPLRVGETLDLASGQREDLLPPGAVSIRPPRITRTTRPPQ
ncbi:MAG: hypothetical protein KBD60_01410 [Sterolibacterium sp.]|jgi:hypothetical protein|nr:hypothetical protein [Sterolibacterium sp.]